MVIVDNEEEGEGERGGAVIILLLYYYYFMKLSSSMRVFTLAFYSSLKSTSCLMPCVSCSVLLMRRMSMWEMKPSFCIGSCSFSLSLSFSLLLSLSYMHEHFLFINYFIRVLSFFSRLSNWVSFSWIYIIFLFFHMAPALIRVSIAPHTFTFSSFSFSSTACYYRSAARRSTHTGSDHDQTPGGDCSQAGVGVASRSFALHHPRVCFYVVERWRNFFHVFFSTCSGFNVHHDSPCYSSIYMFLCLPYTHFHHCTGTNVRTPT